jgi:hypothetical protein
MSFWKVPLSEAWNKHWTPNIKKSQPNTSVVPSYIDTQFIRNLTFLQSSQTDPQSEEFY